MSLYHLGNITTHVHTHAFHSQLEHLGRNTLHATYIIDSCTYSTANATHSSPACALRKTAHSHKLHGIANRSIIASRVVLHGCIRRTVQHTRHALTHNSCCSHSADTTAQSRVRYSCSLGYSVTHDLACHGCTSLSCCTKRRSVSNKAQCSACHSRTHTRLNIRILPVVGHSHALLSILSLLLRHHAHRQDSAYHRVVDTTDDIFCRTLRHITAQFALLKLLSYLCLQARSYIILYIILWVDTKRSCLFYYFLLHLRVREQPSHVFLGILAELIH